jgi:mannopine transport system permease protein
MTRAVKISLLLCLPILAFLIVPTLIVVPVSFSDTDYLTFPPTRFSMRWYQTYLSDPAWINATLFSFKVAGLTTAFSVVIGTMASLALTRGRVPFKNTINLLLLAPLVVPHIIVGIAVYLQFAPLGLTGSTLGFTLIHTALAVPYVVLVVSAALQRIDFSLEMAALSLGASRWRTYLEVVSPLVLPAVGAGAIFAFLTSFDETVVAFFISSVDNQTLTRKLFEDIDYNLTPVIAVVSTLIVVVTVGLTGLGSAFAPKTTR